MQPRENTLTWKLSPAAPNSWLLTCSADSEGGVEDFKGSVAKSGTVKIHPDGNQTAYSVTCVSVSGYATKGYVTVVRPNQRLTSEASTPNPMHVANNRVNTNVQPNAALTLTWRAYPANYGTAVSCVGSGGSSADSDWNKSLSSSNPYAFNPVTVRPTQDTDYILTCSTPGSWYGTATGETAVSTIHVDVQ